MWTFSNFGFFKFLENLGLSNRSVRKHLCKLSLKSTIALSTHWSLNPETSWFFDFKLKPTMFVTIQNRQYGNVGVLLPLLPSIERELEFQPFLGASVIRRAVNGVLRHVVRPSEVTDLPRSGRPRTGMCQQWLETGLSWHYGGLTAQKYTDHILGPHNEPHIDNHALADIVVFKPG